MGERVGNESKPTRALSLGPPHPESQEGNSEATAHVLGHFHMLYSSNQNN